MFAKLAPNGDAGLSRLNDHEIENVQLMMLMITPVWMWPISVELSQDFFINLTTD